MVANKVDGDDGFANDKWAKSRHGKVFEMECPVELVFLFFNSFPFLFFEIKIVLSIWVSYKERYPFLLKIVCLPSKKAVFFSIW